MATLWDEISVRKITDVTDARRAIESTVRSKIKAKIALDKLYRCEHSPMRTQLFWIDIYGLPTFISVHFVRHANNGQLHFVQSNRPDRGGAERVDRDTPVKHSMLLNAQHLVDISRKRLCHQSKAETTAAWQGVKSAVSAIDPEITKYMVRNCVYRGGYCPELIPCGLYDIKIYDPDLIAKEMSLNGK